CRLRPTTRSSRRCTPSARPSALTAFTSLAAHPRCEARLNAIVGRKDADVRSRDGGNFFVSYGSSLWQSSLLRRELAAKQIVQCAAHRPVTVRGARGFSWLARAGVFCSSPVATEFLAVQHSVPFAPNHAFKPTVHAFGAPVGANGVHFPRSASALLGAA